jgi:hypothetical protein
MVPKSRTLKGSRPPLKPFKVHYDTFLFSEFRAMNLRFFNQL